MSERIFDRETLLDISVNIIPLGIIAFFVVAYLAIGDYPGDVVIRSIQLSIMGLTAIGLVVLTYFSGKAISSAEGRAEEAEALVEADGE